MTYSQKSFKYQMRDEIEEIIKTENIDRSRFHEFDKNRYSEIINKFYYAFFDYEKYRMLELHYLWLRIRSDIENEIVQGLNQSESWKEYIKKIDRYLPHGKDKTYFLILSQGWVYEGYIPEIQTVLMNTTVLLDDFYIVSKKFDTVLFHNDDGECMSILGKKR